MKVKKVVITGLGALTPIGNTVPEYWNNLLKGVSGANPITYFDTENYKTKFACEVKNFDPGNLIDRKVARSMDRCGQYAFITALEAIKDSGLEIEKLNKQRVGVILGTAIGGIGSILEALNMLYENGGIPKFSPFLLTRSLGDMISGNIALHYGFSGTNCVVTSACASSANALVDAYHAIQLGKVDIVISGGAEACINQLAIGGFNAMNALSTRNDEFKTASRPFDVTRDGFVMGEGSGTLVLEDYEHAKARGAKIYAELAGVGLVTDTHHITAPHPEGEAAKSAMKIAIDDAKLNITDIGHINTHGTSTPLGDLSECIAIQDLFGTHAYNLSINATKSMTGHMLGAAGAVEAIATILALSTGKVPPTINLKEKDPEIPDFNFVPNHAIEQHFNAAISNSFGFGGHNASLVFSKFD
ncbi:MAG: beta-ketoacyl-ACP synthase II [Bacteroidetes bacterium]|nr:beta-ketoacyl-ACP synthase II [Bacteroidota bacterium]MCL2302857.1 beta-ketoacyl-ACP synthase II [Lentimicrobiaceae bacterium]